MGKNRRNEAGDNLRGEQARQRFGKNAETGAAGERAWARIVDQSGISAKYETFYSMRIPTPKGKKAYKTDVDAIFVNGDTVVLVDVKMWASQKYYWSLGSMQMSNLSVKNSKASKNMEMAVDRYRQHLSHLTKRPIKVVGMVVFAPAGRKGKLPASVWALRWPGGIKSYLPGDAVRKLKSILGRTPKRSDDVISIMESLSA